MKYGLCQFLSRHVFRMLFTFQDGVLYAANSDEDAKKVQELISGCETITIESSHDINYEHPDIFISACEKLLKRTE
jgi:hypothetical protein